MSKRDKEKLSAELKPLRDSLQAHSEESDKTWLDERWWPETRRAHGKISPSRVLFFVVRIGEVSGAAALPVFATAGTLTEGHFWGWVTVAVSLMVALLVAFDTVYRPGVRWRAAYQSFHQLVDAAWLYLEAPVDQAKPREAYLHFQRSVQATITNQQREYLRDIANLNTTATGADGTPAARETGGHDQGTGA